MGRAILRACVPGVGIAVLAALALAGCAADLDPALRPVAVPTLEAPMHVNVTWKVSLGSAQGAFLAPSVQESAIFAASGSGELVRIEPASGKVVWSISVPGGIGAGVGSDGSTVAVVGPRGEVFAYDAAGKELWKVQGSTRALAPPLVGRGLVIVRTGDHHVSAYEIAGAKRRWNFVRQEPALTLHASTPMSFASDTVLVGLPGGRMAALALTNGALRWEAGVSEPRGATEVERLADVLGAPARGDALACAASFQGRIACFDAESGDLRWAREFSAGGGPAYGGEVVYGVDEASTLSAFSRASGATIWQNKVLAHRDLSAPALVSPGLVATADFEGRVHFFSAAEGKLVARFDTAAVSLGGYWGGTGSPLASAPQSWNGALLVQTAGGTLYLLSVAKS
jgi:outer membrane protein assembly factor BamB